MIMLLIYNIIQEEQTSQQMPKVRSRWVAYLIQQSQGELAKKVHNLGKCRVKFDLSASGALLAHVQPRVQLVEQIKNAQLEDLELCQLMEETLNGMMDRFMVDLTGSLWFEN